MKKKKMNDGRKDKNPTDGSALQQMADRIFMVLCKKPDPGSAV